MFNANWTLLKQALISVMIGTAVSFLTALCQALLHWLNAIDANSVGASAGTAWYILRNFRGWC